MSSYDDEKTNLKSIFGDNKYPNGKNFAELIDLPDFRLAENNDGTITVNNVTYDMTKSDLGSIAQISEDFNNLPNGLTFVSSGQNNAPESTSAYWVRTFNSSAYGGRKLQVAQADSSNTRYIRTYNGSWDNWDSLVTDNMDGSITVNGATFIPADNSKVAHLSGANNFDTTPTVNNNPLLLANSLPPDLARLSHDANFTAKLQQNGQDVATADDLKSINQNVLHRDSNTGKATDAIDFGPGKLTADGYQVGGMTVSKDKATAKSDSAAHPGTLFFY